MKTVTQEDIRAIHSRLDAHNEVIKIMIYRLQTELGHATADDLIVMLEESQNPFDKDAKKNDDTDWSGEAKFWSNLE